MGFPRPRILELVAISFCRGSSHPRDQTCISCLGREIVYLWATWEVQFFSRQWENLVELEGDRYNWVSLKGWIQELETGTKESRHTSPFPLCQEPDVDFFFYTTMVIDVRYWVPMSNSCDFLPDFLIRSFGSAVARRIQAYGSVFSKCDPQTITWEFVRSAE